VKSIAAVSRVKVSADGQGVVSHAGVKMLRELVELTGLSAQVTAALADDTYRGLWTYALGAVFTDLAAAVVGGADCIDGVGQRCGDREHVFGPAASTGESPLLSHPDLESGWFFPDLVDVAGHRQRTRPAFGSPRPSVGVGGCARA
jgi:Transposase DDE domain group 1